MRSSWHFPPEKRTTKNGIHIQFWCTLWPQRTHTHTLFQPYTKPSTRAFGQNSTWQQQQQQWLQREWFWSHAWLHVYSFAAYALGQPFAGRVVWKLLVFSVLTAICCDFLLCFVFVVSMKQMFSGVAGSQSLMRTCISLYKICTICKHFFNVDTF